MPTKALSCKKEALCEHGPEAPSCLWARSFKRTVSKWEKCSMVRRVKFDILLEITDAVSSGLREGKTFQRVVSVKVKSQHLWWYGGCLEVCAYVHMGSLHVLERHYECWKVCKVLEEHMKSSFPKRYTSILIVFMKMTFFYLDPYILLIFNYLLKWSVGSVWTCYTMIVKWNNNIVDYKCKVFFFFFFYATNPSFFFMLVYVLKKKENMHIWHQGLVL